MLGYPRTKQPEIKLEVGDILELVHGYYVVAIVGENRCTIISIDGDGRGWWWYNPMPLRDLQRVLEADKTDFVYHGKHIKMVAAHV